MNESSSCWKKNAMLVIATAAMVFDAHVNAATTSFSFLTPWNDATSDFVNVSSLNDGPAGSHGFITVQNGHFVESNTGNRVRFLGTNLTFDSLFPSNADAVAIAAHLAKYGINVVRLHHADNTFTWVDAGGKIWETETDDDHLHISPSQLALMDYLVYQLEQKGIYVDMCLHVSRTFGTADGFLAGVTAIPFSFDKRIDIYDPQMITDDQQYFHDLLTHLNPYTGKTYASDPGLLNVEINNENSLLGLYGDTPGSNLWALPAPYSSELASLWNAWLLKKYGNTANLAAAWYTPDGRSGTNLFPASNDPSDWTLELQPGNTATISSDQGGVRVNVTQIDNSGLNWHIRLYEKGLSLLTNGTQYSLGMDLMSDVDSVVGVGAYLDTPPPNLVSLGPYQNLDVTTRWETPYETFTAINAENGHELIPVLDLGTRVGTTWVRNVTLETGTAGFTLSPDQTLEAGTVLMDPQGHLTPRADWLQFLADTETAYVNNMRSYLQTTLGVKQLIFCSQSGYGGIWSNYRETSSACIDHHGYWDGHDKPNDVIKNTPMVSSLGNNDALTTSALQMNANQPKILTEYNQCFPNEYRAEALPSLASFAAFQDWDAIFVFCHQGYGASGAAENTYASAGDTTSNANNFMNNAYDASVDPAMWGFLPSAALMFRSGLVPIAPTVQTVGLPATFPASQVAGGLTFQKAWQGVDPLTPFKFRVQMGIGLPSVTPGTNALTGALTVSTSSPAQYLANAPAAKAVVGFVGGTTVTLSGVSFAFGSLTNNFGALTLVAMDGQPLAQSSQMLLTMVTHTQNTGQTWNAARTQVTVVGATPPIVNAAAVTVTIPTSGPRSVYALDNTGAELSSIPSTYTNGNLSFAITSAQTSIWFAITNPNATESVTFNSSTDIPITASSYTINGAPLNLTLGYAPAPGTVLTLIQITGGSLINGTFTNLPNGGTITATYNGIAYTFTANYSGGSGYNLTLTLTGSAPVSTSDTPLLPLWSLLVLVAAVFTIGCSGSALNPRHRQNHL